MLWINFIHLYQPANSPVERIKEAADKSYYRLTRLLEENRDLHFTANISGCLLERLVESGFSDLIERWRRLIEEGRLEIVGSAAYHGFLPLLPEEEVFYQIKRQEEIVADILKVDLKGGGFFLPELAYTPELSKLIKKLGYSWLIVDEASLPAGVVYDGGTLIDGNSGITTIVRHRNFSNAYAPDLIQELIGQDKANKTIITATDAELYGLRHEDPTAELEKMAALTELETQTVSTFLSKQIDLKNITLQSATWETNWEIDKGQPFAVWNEKGNKIQRGLWELAYFAIKTGHKYSTDQNFAAYRWHLDRGLASCMFWWASGRDFFHNMGPVAWNPDEIENGLNDLIRSVRSLQDKKSQKEKVVAEKLVARIRQKVWQKHWQKYF
ncbi:hypothetical protein CVU83_02245 [Candidatus Falkowbacteria bacterium HGW-Falkowbacteria-2]|uniref:Glycoside hydrolase family 57 N-terminal domain-containing protein n=1 Tax=Candidatus Falkowbacteria bacterium HGW-Falkowbacteria-2 TaxID=2013769 RepID=A0A2N2DZW8_9BACT|nr:MAG: hypothetical protein CVU83_02245 [Candidatus Falkowbacteria bacterium HGW-Falkowbacteria-2]